jgi:hypothetical protein
MGPVRNGPTKEPAMTKYLVSFTSGAMELGPGGLQAAADAARAVVRETRAAGVWAFEGGIDESVAPILVTWDGTVTEGTYSQNARIKGGYTVLDVPSRDEALAWATEFAVACRCAQEVRLFQDDPGS